MDNLVSPEPSEQLSAVALSVSRVCKRMIDNGFDLQQTRERMLRRIFFLFAV
jgi:hypothetical protein